MNISQGTDVTVIAGKLSPGTHTLTLTASDVSGKTGTASVSITVNERPVAGITGPDDGSTFDYNASITLTGGASDAEDGDVADGSLAWSSDLGGDLGTGASLPLSGGDLSPATTPLR